MLGVLFSDTLGAEPTPDSVARIFLAIGHPRQLADPDATQSVLAAFTFPTRPSRLRNGPSQHAVQSLDGLLPPLPQVDVVALATFAITNVGRDLSNEYLGTTCRGPRVVERVFWG